MRGGVFVFNDCKTLTKLVSAAMDQEKRNDEKDDMAPPEMPSAYHKARRQLSLFSAILIFWEYVGIRVGDKAAEPVTAKLPVADTKIRFENPEVIPLVISVIVIYFTFRLTIEWLQIMPRRRRQAASRIDLIVSYSLAVAALLLYVFQKVFSFRLADVLTPDAFLTATAGFLIGFFFGVSFVQTNAIKNRIAKIWSRIFLSLVAFAVLFLFLFLRIKSTEMIGSVFISFFVGLFIGSSIGVGGSLSITKIKHYWRLKAERMNEASIAKEEDTPPES